MTSINIAHDFTLDIATGHSRMSKKWSNRKWQWSQLVERCSQTQRTAETMAEYNRMGKEEQSNVKDVGGFVGGYLSQGVRKNANVLYRTVATLDIDYGTENVWDDFTLAFDFAAMLYSTHKHSSDKPRYRLVFPLSRQVSPAEYEPLCRKIAEALGLDLFDDSTYQLPRLFYWPSTSKDAEFVFEYQDGPACNVDEVLAQYVDYTDVSAWPLSSRESHAVAHEIKRAGDPHEKPGVIGAFCRAYSIEEVIETFLADKYEPTAVPDRYTYKLGSVSGGLVCYEGKFAFSHHDTDPASRQLCNAFDLCRIHLFGAQDEGSRAQDVTRKPSYIAMQDLAGKDSRVRVALARERQQTIDDDFNGVGEEEEPQDDAWKADLEWVQSGERPKNTIKNVVVILENDRNFKGKLRHNLFTGSNVAVGKLPWDRQGEQWTDSDDANLRVWLEKTYGITGKEKISDALTSVLSNHTFHPIRDYLNGLKWDGVPRLDRIIIDCLGAEDNALNRAMSRKQFTAAVARVFNPGCKYDYCLVFTGAEGVGKSTLLRIMGGAWFNDSITSMEGKEGMEQLRYAWVIELGELTTLRRSEVEQVKAFLSKQVDIYRPAFARRVVELPRQCVFFGTTNEALFLKGDNGNRRFWVIPIDSDLRKHSNMSEALTRDRDQLWAEAMHYFKQGEQLYLNDELEQQARQRQKEFNDDHDDPLVSMLGRFLNTPLPADWATRGLAERRIYFRDMDNDMLSAAGTIKRDKVCAAEFICEMMGRDITDKEYKYLARKVGKMIAEQPGWERGAASRHAAKLYGVQKIFTREKYVKEDSLEDDEL